jgi:hypothetical protein
MNELAILIQDWFVIENIEIKWQVIKYNDFADLLLYGSKPIKYVTIIFEDYM